ncbi:P-loop containing nucleoside triphosphate hydrolase protein [Poronia punctata]|nr:P-loop containing nucleoside triphosphate hydrolase protein [Poronia punctata]
MDVVHSYRPQQLAAAAQSEASFRDLFAFTAPRQFWLLAAGLVAAIFSGVLKLSLPILLGKVFAVFAQFGSGQLAGSETSAQISSWCVLLVVMGAAGWLVNFAFMFSWMAFGEVQARNIRRAAFRGLLVKHMQWFDGQQDGVASLLVRTQTQTRELQIASSLVVGSLFAEMATSVANLALSLYTAWRLTLILLASIPLSLVILGLLSRPVKAAIQAQKKELARASKYTHAAISAIDLVKVFNGHDHETWLYQGAIRASMQKYLAQAWANAWQFGYVKLWVDSLFVAGFYYGAVLVEQGLSPGSVLTTFYAALAALQATEAFVPLYLALANGVSANQALRAISHDLEGGPEVYPIKGGHIPEQCLGDIQIRNASLLFVSFAYPSNPSRTVLHNSSFHFRAGELSFIVGRSGSGKSTVGNLLVKFYEPLRGEIFLDRTDIRTLDIDWLRNNVTLVQQSTVVFNDSFFMNVALGRINPDRVSAEEVQVGCETALLQSTVSNLPRSLDTYIGTGGHNLSGGQKQRLALARARLRDPPVLILDEVTGGLDPTSRELVMEAVRQWRRDKTTIVITHDVAQIEDGDFVYVMEDGHVVQQGLCSDLRVQDRGLFAHFQAVPTSPSPTEPADAAVQKNRHRKITSSVVNFSRPLSDASQKGPLFVGSPSPGEALRGVPFCSTDVFSMARSSSKLRLLGVNSRHQMDASGTLNALASSTEYAPRKGLSRVAASLSRQFSFFHEPPCRRSWESESSATSAPQLSPIKTGSIFRLQLFGDAIQSSRQVSEPRTECRRWGVATSQTTEEVQNGVRAVREADKVRREDTTVMPLMSIYQTVWPHLELKDKLSLAIGFGMALVVAGSVPAFSFVFANLLGSLYEGGNKLEAGRKWAIILLSIAISGAVATFLSHYLLERAGQAWIYNLRMQAFSRVIRQPKGWFDDPRHSPNRIAECLDRNAEEMRNLVGRFAPLLLLVVVMILTSVAWAMAISWKLTLVSLASGPCLISATKGYSAVSNKWEVRCNTAADEAHAVMSETFVNIRVVRAFTLEGYFGRKHDEAVQHTFRLGIKKAIFTAALFACWQSMFWFMMALIFWYASVLSAVEEEITVHGILQVINLLVLGLSTASNILNSVPANSTAQARASELLYYARLSLGSSHEAKGTKKLARPFPIRLNGLSFRYPSQPNHVILRGLTLSFEAGTSTAIVGPSGCGKSTVVSIILGLHVPDSLPVLSGRSPAIRGLTFSSVPFDEVDISSLRACIGYVPQTPFLFPRSIADNIAYGLPEDSPLRALSNLEQAAREAEMHDFIRSLSDGYGTMVGDGGQSLSGGQAQRLCIARALARRPKLLVLDEPTSALDGESAEGVRNTIRTLLRPEAQDDCRKLTSGYAMEGRRCVIMVTHNLEMMKMADRVAVMDLGRLVETGTYAELRERKGKFAELISGGVWTGSPSRPSFGRPSTHVRNEVKDPSPLKQTSELPLRQSDKEGGRGYPVTPRWIGARAVDWNPQSASSTGILSPMASPFSRPSRRRDHRADEGL